MEDFIYVSEETLRSFCVSALKKCGLDNDDASTMSDVLVTADKWGINTHGVRNLYGYLQKKEAGGVSFTEKPQEIVSLPSLSVIDANNCMGYISSAYAMDIACNKAKENGIAISIVKNSSHNGAIGYYANMAAARGMIGFATTNVDKKMGIPGAKGIVMGHNPFAMAAPAESIPSIILDISSSNVASLKVLRAKDNKEEIPDNWISDKNGLPTTDPSNYPDEGALLPFGNHKGYGVALFIEIITSVITGMAPSTSDNVKSWCFDMDEPNNVCHAFIAINPMLIDTEGIFKDNVDKLIDDIHKSPKADGTDRITVPGERMWDNYQKAEEKGIKLSRDIISELDKISEKFDMNYIEREDKQL